jgi:hypothetical protein
MGGGSDLTSEFESTYDLGDPSLVPCLVLLSRHPELTELIEVWESLPTAIRAGVMATIRAAVGDAGQC